MFRALAAFLAAHGQISLEQYLDGEISTQKPLDLTAKLNLFIAGLTSGDYILCFDDFHLVKDAADIADLFSEIRDRYPGARAPLPARFIIMGREMPEAMQYLAPEALGGLNEADTRAFLLANSLNLSDTLLRSLWQRTTGNPKLLELSVTALAELAGDSVAITDFIDTMAAQRNLRDFVMHEIYESLSPVERVVAGALSIFPTAIPQKVVESILAGEEVKDIIEVLDALIGKNLASESEGRVGCHSLVREFSYRLLSREDAETFHGRAADYYEREKDIRDGRLSSLRAGRRNTGGRSADQKPAGDRQCRTGRRHAGAVEPLSAENLTAEQWSTVCQAKGTIYETRGDFAQALQTYETGLEEAIDDQTCAEWLCRIGHTYLVKGEYDQTLAYCQRCLETCEGAADPSRIADAHCDVGWAYLRTNQLDEATSHFLQSRQIAETRLDHHRQAKATLGLGAVAQMQDKLAEAKQCYEQSRRGFYQAGDRTRVRPRR